MPYLPAPNAWKSAYDAVGCVITCSGMKPSSSSPFLEFRIEGTLSGYHVHVKSEKGAQIETIRYKADLSNHASGDNIIKRSHQDQSCSFQTVINWLNSESYFVTADMVGRLKAAHETWRKANA